MVPYFLLQQFRDAGFFVHRGDEPVPLVDLGELFGPKAEMSNATFRGLVWPDSDGRRKRGPFAYR